MENFDLLPRSVGPFLVDVTQDSKTPTSPCNMQSLSLACGVLIPPHPGSILGVRASLDARGVDRPSNRLLDR